MDDNEYVDSNGDDDDDDGDNRSNRNRNHSRNRYRGPDYDEKERNRIQLQIAKIHNNIGCAYFEVGELEEAREAFECTLEIQREHHESSTTKSTVPTQLAMSSTDARLTPYSSSLLSSKVLMGS